MCRVLAFCALLVFTPSVALAAKTQPSPAPARITFGLSIRSYSFSRTNASGYGLPQTTNVRNQFSTNAALAIHGSYRFARRWSIAGTYLYANPMNNCQSIAEQLQPGGPCGAKTTGTNPDNTLPAFRLSTLYEAYLQYQSANVQVRAGNQLLATPWANGADTRLKPASYQGVDASAQIAPDWLLEAAVIDRFESRVQSDFVNSTLLTETNQIPTAGFEYAHLRYQRGRTEANLYHYRFVDIANAEWFDAKWLARDAVHAPFVAIHGGAESNAGRSVLGKIDSQVIGIQGGITPVRNLDLTLGFDRIPQKSDTTILPAGVSCTTTAHQIVVTGKTPFRYFLPTGGTPDCFPHADGTTTVYYGGWASPYTDSYTSDPLYTTSMTGGMVERRSPGGSAKFTANWWNATHQVRLIASFALYSYGNNSTGVAPARELDLDGTYYFSHMPVSGPYRGFSLRHRYGERDMTFVQLYGGLPVFKYNRTQLEYDL